MCGGGRSLMRSLMWHHIGLRKRLRPPHGMSPSPRVTLRLLTTVRLQRERAFSSVRAGC